VWLVDGQNKLQPRTVKLGRSMGDAVVITEGLNAGDQYVLEGLMTLQPGVTVKPVQKAASASRSVANASIAEAG
jgi:multidrug efflux pump subunit AcrA (membrane-fusion protein)